MSSCCADGPDASPHLRSRRETGQRLASAGVPVTTLRAAMIIGKGSAAFETILGLVKRLGSRVDARSGNEVAEAVRP